MKHHTVEIRSRLTCLALAGAMIVLAAFPLGAAGPRAVIDTPTVALGTVARGTDGDGVIVVRNEGDQTLHVALAQASERIVPRNLPLDLAPGGTAHILLSIRTDGVEEFFRGEAVLRFDDPALPQAAVAVVCRVANPIELFPPTGFAVNVVRGQMQEAAVEIVNRERAPLQLGMIEQIRDGLSTRLEELEPGQRYRLVLAVQGDGPAAARADTIAIQTSSVAMPILTIPARTTIRERVRVSPESLSLGRIRMSDVAAAIQVAAQTLVVTRTGTEDFLVRFVTNLPMLDIQARRAPGADRWHANITLKRERVYPGPISGFIFVETSDPEYPSVSVPVVGEIVAK